MVKTFESALKTVMRNKRKWLLRLNQKVLEEGTALDPCAFVTHTPPGQEQAPNPTYFSKWNVETPYCSLRGQQAARFCLWRCGSRISEEANAVL